MAADIDTLRMLIGDRVKVAVNEVVGEGDGINVHFQLDMYPLVEDPSAHVFILETGVAASTSVVTISGGIGRITWASASVVEAGDTILCSYKYHALTSGELSDILSGHTGSPYLAAANACLVLAADASRLFAYTMGDKSVDKRKVADNLRELAKEYENRHYKMRDDIGFAADQWTLKDSTGTPYYDFDTAVAYLSGTS